MTAPRNPSAVLLANDESVWVPAREGLYTYEGEAGWNHQLTVQTDPAVRCNDAAVDPWGQIIVGTMHETAHPQRGKLYRIGLKGDIEVLLEDVTISNGLDWSPDRSTLYYVDTPTHRVDKFSYQPDEALASREAFVEIDPKFGNPDGLTVDQAGNVWVALWGHGQVHEYDPRGQLKGVFETGAPYTSACCFGGENLDTLFVTTAGHDPVTTDADPDIGGAVYAVSGVGRGVLPMRSRVLIR